MSQGIASGTSAGGLGSMKDLTDSNITSPVDKEVLKFNSTSGKWENIDGSTLESFEYAEDLKAGDAIKVTSDGSVGKIYKPLQTVSEQAANLIDGNISNSNKLIYDEGIDRLICMYMHSGQIQLKLGTISGDSVSFGSNTLVKSSASYDLFNKDMKIVHMGESKYLLAYRTSNTVYVRILDVSGGSISLLGTENSVSNANYGLDLTYNPDRGDFLLVSHYGSEIRNGTISISGTSIDYNSHTTMHPKSATHA